MQGRSGTSWYIYSGIFFFRHQLDREGGVGRGRSQLIRSCCGTSWTEEGEREGQVSAGIVLFWHQLSGAEEEDKAGTSWYIVVLFRHQLS